jgi:CheY-like chemotaxis protein
MSKGGGMSKQADARTTVLVVEDDGYLRSFMRRELKERGYRVLTAQDGEEAVELLECISCAGPQLILTDIQMPSLGNLLEVATEHPRLRDIPMVAVEPKYSGEHDSRIRVLEDYEELNNLLT